MKSLESVMKEKANDVFDVFYSFSLKQSEMCFVIGGDDPPTIDPQRPLPLP